MFIKHTDYSEGVYEVFLKEEVGRLRIEEPFFGNVDVRCRMDKAHHQIVLDCFVNTQAKLQCDRCGVQYDAALKNNFKLIFLFEVNENDEEVDDVFYLAPDDDKLEISRSVREYVILSIPLKKLCSEDCKGLCPSCGVNMNVTECNCSNDTINPIWEKLKELKK